MDIVWHLNKSLEWLLYKCLDNNKGNHQDIMDVANTPAAKSKYSNSLVSVFILKKEIYAIQKSFRHRISAAY